MSAQMRVKVDLIPLQRETPKAWLRTRVSMAELCDLISDRAEGALQDGWRLVTSVSVSDAVVLVFERLPGEGVRND